MTGRRVLLAQRRKAAGFSQESLAEALGLDRSTIVRWESGRSGPQPWLRHKLADALGVSVEALRELLDGVTEEAGPTARLDLELAFTWLDQQTGRAAGTSRQAVSRRMVNGRPDRPDRMIGRSQLAGVLSAYYDKRRAGHGTYRASVGDQVLETAILTREAWLDLACPLSPDTDRICLSASADDKPMALDEDAAIRRLVEVGAGDVRMINAPIYRLLNVDLSPTRLAGVFGVAPFIEYALTMDLLERELIDAVARDPVTTPGLPLRERYLPDTESVLDVGGRLCAGGALALCAIARPADPYRGGADYMLLVQERSSYVINAARRLAVIPKGFHGPVVDYRADTRIGATLRRETEEELFGRLDVDSTIDQQRVAAPMHPSRLSEPMRWLTERADRMRTECTGFGLNLVSGNYEFASLIVIDDEEFWPLFGGQVEANWEAAGLQLYSTLDAELFGELVADESWSNEGLFALLQGLRRLRQIDGSRVGLPAIEWELGT